METSLFRSGTMPRLSGRGSVTHGVTHSLSAPEVADCQDQTAIGRSGNQADGRNELLP